MYRLDLKEYKPNPTHLSDYLPWALLRSPSVLECKEPALVRVLQYRGKDMQSMNRFDLNHVAVQFNRAAVLLGEGFSLQIETSSRWVNPPTAVTSGIGAVDAVEYARIAKFRSHAPLEVMRYITLTYLPPKTKKASGIERVAALFGGLFQGQQTKEKDEGQLDIESFVRRTNDFASQLKESFVEIKWLEDDDLLTYLYACCNDEPQYVKTPEIPMYLDAVIGASPTEVGTRLRVGKNHVHVVTIKNYPKFSHPELMDRFRYLGFEHRWVNRYLGLSEDESKGMFAIKGRMARGDTSTLENKTKTGDVSVGYHSCMVVVWDTDQELALEKAQLVKNQLSLCGYVSIIETGNTWGAWLSTMPGHVWSNPRRSIISSKNLSHMVALGSDWMGDPVSTHLGHAPHVYCLTDAGGLYCLNLNVRDVGHTLVLGPTGGGKSTFLALLQLQWLKYPNARVVTFDKGRSARAVCLACDGEFLELGRQDINQTICFQPLRYIDQPNERAWAAEWLEDIYVSEGVHIGFEERQAIGQALLTLASSPQHHRTLTLFSLALQNSTLIRALNPYLTSRDGEGSEAWLWDNDNERLADSRWICFEMSALMSRGKRSTNAVLTYLFHRLEQSFDSRSPTLLVLDEAWVFLADESFSKRIKIWLKELRKKGVYVVFATQDISDAMDSAIASTLLSNCPTQILLPNSKAQTPEMKPYYLKLGLSEAAIELIRREGEHGTRSYYFKNNRGSRLFSLALEPGHIDFALATASSDKDHALIDSILKTKRPNESFGRKYVKALGFEQYVQFFDGGGQR